MTPPGFHLKSPLTSVVAVQTSMQTDRVTKIPCGTSGGVMIEFERIEVVNRLRPELAHATVRNYTTSYDQTWIFARIHHEVNQFCSAHTLHQVVIELFADLDEELQRALQHTCDEWAPGVEIVAVRVTKPVVPASIQQEFVRQEGETRATPGGLLAIPDLRSRLLLERSTFDEYIHRLHAERVIHLLSHVDGGHLPEDVRANCMLHSGGALLYWIRWL